MDRKKISSYHYGNKKQCINSLDIKRLTSRKTVYVKKGENLFVRYSNLLFFNLFFPKNTCHICAMPTINQCYKLNHFHKNHYQLFCDWQINKLKITEEGIVFFLI